MELTFDRMRNDYSIVLKNNVSHTVYPGTDARGNLIRLDNGLKEIPEKLENAMEHLDNLYKQQEATKAEFGKPFPQEIELTEKSRRLAQLDAALNMEETVAEHSPRGGSKTSVLADLKEKSAHIQPSNKKNKRDEMIL